MQKVKPCGKTPCSINNALTLYGQKYVDTFVHIIVYISGVVFYGLG